MVVKLIRNVLGYTIVGLDLITRGSKQKRPAEKQAKIEKELENMSLYQFTACPFCIKTRRALHKMNLPMEMRNAEEGKPGREELLAGGGKIQVPCLRVQENGKDIWMYESGEIISYLEKRFA